MGAPAVSVVVPFFNEAGNAAALAERIRAVFEKTPELTYECVFVDDGSRDGTGGELARIAAADQRVRVLHFRENKGQSAALYAGMQHGRGNVILTMDGVLQNDPADFPRAVELLKDYDFVCGVRVNRQDSWSRKVSSRVANRVRNWVLRDGISDTGCGLKGFRRNCLEHFVCFNGVHRFFAVFVRNAGLRIVECPVEHHPRQRGQSKYGVGNRLWRGMFDLVGVAWLRRRHVVYELVDAPFMPPAHVQVGAVDESLAQAAAHRET
ncbi:MAG: glycosyltransferase family 2 protein [Candidatus Hydrogenedentales bacterium]